MGKVISEHFLHCVKSMFRFKPVRKINNKGYRTIIYMHPSEKIKRMVKCEFALESGFAELLDYDPNVTNYCEQPIKLNIRLEGKWRPYTPDFVVERASSHKLILVEIKPKDKVQEYKEKFNQARKAAAQKGFDFCVVTDEFIYAEPRYSNIKYLRRYSRSDITRDSFNITTEYFNQHSGRSYLFETQKFLCDRGVIKNEFIAMMYRKIILIDVCKTFGPNSILTLNIM